MPRRRTDRFLEVCATFHSSGRRAALLRRSWLFPRAPRRLPDRYPMLPANGRVRSSYLHAHATQCLRAAADQLAMEEELEPPPLATGLAVLAQARSLWKRQGVVGEPPTLP